MDAGRLHVEGMGSKSVFGALQDVHAAGPLGVFVVVALLAAAHPAGACGEFCEGDGR